MSHEILSTVRYVFVSISNKMSACACARVAAYFILFIFIQSTCALYEVPEVTIQALKPKGFKASIPGKFDYKI